MSQQSTQPGLAATLSGALPDSVLPTPSKGLGVYFLPRRALMGDTSMNADGLKAKGDHDSAKPGGPGQSSSQLRGSGSTPAGSRGTPMGSGSKGGSKQRKPYDREDTSNPRSGFGSGSKMVTLYLTFSRNTVDIQKTKP